jgi:hypothetical protein
LSVQQLSPLKDASLAGHLDYRMNFRSTSITVGLPPIIRRDSRHAVQANRTLALHDSALDSRQMVPHTWTCRAASSLNFRLQANLDFGFGEAVMINRRLRPGIPGCLRSTDNRKTRFDLRRALGCDLIAVISRKLPQSAHATRPCGLLLACSLSGTSNLLQPPFPKTATYCRTYASSTGNLAVSEGSDLRLAPKTLAFVTVLISYACRIFKNALRLPSSAFPHEAQLSPVFSSHVDELVGLRRLVLTG